MTICVDQIFKPSDDIVARVIEDELIIVPLISGIGDLDDELFTLNDSGRAIWSKLNGKNSLKNVIDLLVEEYEAPVGVIKEDVIGLVEELLKRRMLVESEVI